jgi:hypothetical protein
MKDTARQRDQLPPFARRPQIAVSGVMPASPIRFDARAAPDSGHIGGRIDGGPFT